MRPLREVLLSSATIKSSSCTSNSYGASATLEDNSNSNSNNTVDSNFTITNKRKRSISAENIRSVTIEDFGEYSIGQAPYLCVMHVFYIIQ
jgi:hypothetical protein